MKTIKFFTLQIILIFIFVFPVYSQTAKVPKCNMFLENKIVTEITLEDAIKWSELIQPTVQCDDGKVYKLETFKINYLSLKPFVNNDFGIGEGGFPILAQNAIKKGKSGDTIILKEINYHDAEGNLQTIPSLSLKIK